jgi:hypothetical protein
MVQILYEVLSKSDPNYYYIGIPKDWSGASNKEVTVIVSDSIRALLSLRR